MGDATWRETQQSRLGRLISLPTRTQREFTVDFSGMRPTAQCLYGGMIGPKLPPLKIEKRPHQVSMVASLSGLKLIEKENGSTKRKTRKPPQTKNAPSRYPKIMIPILDRSISYFSKIVTYSFSNTKTNLMNILAQSEQRNCFLRYLAKKLLDRTTLMFQLQWSPPMRH